MQNSFRQQWPQWPQWLISTSALVVYVSMDLQGKNTAQERNIKDIVASSHRGSHSLKKRNNTAQERSNNMHVRQQFSTTSGKLRLWRAVFFQP